MTDAFVLALVMALAALMSGALIVLLLPWFRAYALARPNARSSHREPTPQGGGAAVVAATLATAWLGAWLAGAIAGGTAIQVLVLTVAVAVLAVVGAIDDMRTLPALPRLLAQCAAVGLVIAMLPSDLRVVSALPWWTERIGLVVAGLWFVNLTNFMDGIDWITVAEAVPITGVIALLGVLGVVPALAELVAGALLGAMLAFAPFNKPVARLFLGDVGSLPIGLVLAWLLLQLAASGHIAAALLLPLYYIADATLTLLRRLAAREPVWEAHRTHFYQRATDRGFSVTEIVVRVFTLNLALAALALLTVAQGGIIISAIALAAGAALVGGLLASFARGKKP